MRSTVQEFIYHPQNMHILIVDKKPTFGEECWCYARHPTGHMLATHASAPISFGERGAEQYFANILSLIPFWS